MIVRLMAQPCDEFRTVIMPLRGDDADRFSATRRTTSDIERTPSKSRFTTVEEREENVAKILSEREIWFILFVLCVGLMQKNRIGGQEYFPPMLMMFKNSKLTSLRL